MAYAHRNQHEAARPILCSDIKDMLVRGVGIDVNLPEDKNIPGLNMLEPILCDFINEQEVSQLLITDFGEIVGNEQVAPELLRECDAAEKRKGNRARCDFPVFVALINELVKINFCKLNQLAALPEPVNAVAALPQEASGGELKRRTAFFSAHAMQAKGTMSLQTHT